MTPFLSHLPIPVTWRLKHALPHTHSTGEKIEVVKEEGILLSVTLQGRGYNSELLASVFVYV